jgi:hypothetical protein
VFRGNASSAQGAGEKPILRISVSREEMFQWNRLFVRSFRLRSIAGDCR